MWLLIKTEEFKNVCGDFSSWTETTLIGVFDSLEKLDEASDMLQKEIYEDVSKNYKDYGGGRVNTYKINTNEDMNKIINLKI